MASEFDAREATLRHAGDAEKKLNDIATRLADWDRVGAVRIEAEADAVNAVACGLVYVGTQLERIADLINMAQM